MKRHARLRAVLVATVAVSLLGPATSGPESPPGIVTGQRGQTTTVLPDGRWLILGGEGAAGPVGTGALVDPRLGARSAVPLPLGRPRAWHTATLLPDGAVLILGGVGADGRVIAAPELFTPDALAFEALRSTPLAPRAHHTATLLTDGSVLIAGGVTEAGSLAADVEVWSPYTRTSDVISGGLAAGRQGHTATLRGDGAVLLWGGVDEQGVARESGELFDPARRRFTLLTARPPDPDVSDLPHITEALPASGAADVPIGAVLALRFSKPLALPTLGPSSLMLSGPEGIEDITIVVAERGRLAFITPRAWLRPGRSYVLTVNGPADSLGLPVPFTTIVFTTAPARGPSATPEPSSAEGSATDPQSRTSPRTEGRSDPDDDPWEWKGERRDGRPYSKWQSLPALQASPGVTAVAAQVLRLNGNPLPGVTLIIGEQQARTDQTGRFLVTSVVPGRQELIIDGRSASVGTRTFGVFEVGVTVTAGTTTILPYTIWMPRIDTDHEVPIASPTLAATVVTTPRLPGLELHLPANTTIFDHEWKVARRISITPVPVDRPPFPLPPNFDTTAYFTIQPGAGYVRNRGLGARLVYPNYRGRPEPPGTPFSFWQYEPEDRGWYVYGKGRVTRDGRQVAPDPGVAIYEFTGAGCATPSFCPAGASCPPPATAPTPAGVKVTDPVDAATGLFLLEKTDLALNDVLPVALTRTYRPGDPTSRAFGVGSTHPYAMFLYSANPYAEIDLILPDGARIHYVRTTPGAGFPAPADVFEHTATPTRFYKSRIVWNGGWQLTLTDGTALFFGANEPLSWIRDRDGNTITVERYSSGNISKVTSPNGRWIEFDYDIGERIGQARDSLGRAVRYAYDASGRLSTVTDPAGGVTTYTYDTAHRMLTATDARGIKFVRNEYDAAGRVTRQTQADNTTYRLAYTLDGTGRIVRTDLTDPRGNVRRLTFNASGYPVTDTRAFGTPLAQTLTYERLYGTTNLVTAVIDALGRRTAFGYDDLATGKGNLLGITRMAGTSEALTTTFTYHPAFNQVATITDPLAHTTTFGYDGQGKKVLTITDATAKVTTLTYDAAGQPLTIKDPLDNVTTFTYTSGGLATIKDPLDNTTTLTRDTVGRVTEATNPLGQRTSYTHDVLNRLTGIVDALGQAISFTYDANGNLRTLTDGRGKVTQYAYDTMDRVTTRTDPLLRAESYQYDAGGNTRLVTDRKLQATTLTFDVLDRLSQSTHPDGSTTTYAYDAGNRLTTVTDSVAGTIQLAYDGFDRVLSQTTGQGVVSYTYDGAGRRTSMTVPGAPPIAYTYGYDNVDRLTSILRGTTTLVTFTYDAAGRRTKITYVQSPTTNDVSATYTYDQASRVSAITYAKGSTTIGTLTYGYDAAGHRISLGGSWARTGLPPSVASATYDAANRQTAWGAGGPLTYDANGNLTSDGTNTYTWDTRDRLVAINGGALTASFQYDGLGRRTAKTVNGTTTAVLHDGINPLQELSGGTVVANLLPGLGVDDHLLRTDSAGTRGFLKDALGSTVALTDDAGAQTHYTYEPFGTTAVSGAPSANAWQYTGRENDGTGLYYYRARYYHPGFQRFISEDPIGLLGGDLNLYSYVFNNPQDLVDPTGEAALAGCLVGGLLNVAEAKLAGRKPTLIGFGIGCATGAAGYGLVKAIPTVLHLIRARSLAAATVQTAVRSNRAAGMWSEEQVASRLAAEGNEIIGSRATAVTDAGRRVIDILMTTPMGQLVAVEVKSGAGVRTAAQMAKDVAMAARGARLVGENAGALTGRTVPSIPTIIIYGP